MTTKGLKELFHQETGHYAENNLEEYIKWIENQVCEFFEKEEKVNNLFNE